MKITLSSIAIGAVLSLSPTPARGTINDTTPVVEYPQAMLRNGKMAPVELGDVMSDDFPPIDPNPMSPIVETTENLHLGAYWGSCGSQNMCTGYKLGGYKCILWDSCNWEYDAQNTAATINGYVLKPYSTWKYCLFGCYAMYGYFKVPEERCFGRWGTFWLDACSGEVARYSAILWDLGYFWDFGWDREGMCLSQPAYNPGQWEGAIKPVRCEYVWGWGYWEGIFEVEKNCA